MKVAADTLDRPFKEKGMTTNERVFVKMCVKTLGEAVGLTRPFAKELGLSVDDTRRIWKQILLTTASGGGKFQ